MSRTFEEKSPIEQEMYVIRQCDKHLQKLGVEQRARVATYIVAAVRLPDPKNDDGVDRMKN